MKAFKNYPLVFATLFVGIVVTILYLTANPGAAQVTATVYVAVIIVWVGIGMVKDIMRGHWGIDILAVIAMVATLATGEYAAALIVALMLTGGEALEDYAEHHAKAELTALLDQTPETAHVLDSVDSVPREVPASEVRVGDLILVRPSEVVPVDAVLVGTPASFDTTSLTGESLPVSFTAGEEVPSGAVNGIEAVHMRAVRRSDDSQFQRIISLVREAQEAKAPIVRLADRFAVPFTAFSLLLGGVAWAISGDATRFAEVMVLATPCPLLIAAPVAFLGGQSQTAKNGIIVKGGSVLEALSRVKSVGFDKTGTLTQGRPELVTIRPTEGRSEDELLRLAASAEQYSTHVFAAGVLRAAKNRDIPLSPGENASELATAGIEAAIEGASVRVGKLNYIQELDPAAEAAELEPGQAGAYVTINGTYAGALILSDVIRPETANVVGWLRTHGAENIVILTGDAQTTADAIAAQAGITTVHADLQPEDKVRLISALSPGATLMVGDGINDAPVLAAADVGIAMGAKGATAAGEAADAVILYDDLARVADTVAIAKHTVTTALTAIWIGIGLSVGLMFIAAFGFIPAVMGALAQEFVDLAAILYALRARAAKPVHKQLHAALAAAPVASISDQLATRS